jgi:hypothetical protein
MELISKEINGVTVYVWANYDQGKIAFDQINDFLPSIRYDKGTNKYEISFKYIDSEWGEETTCPYYFNSIQDIIKFLGLDIEEEK